MVGANYMGGKRNTARAKSKDVVGRAQRRHFGKQRLASALCATQESRVRPSAPTPSSVLPEIMLAHARLHASADSGVTSSRNVFSEDRLYSSTSPSNTTRRNKPSKVLGALDILDHMCMRAAIERILQQPNLIGITTPNHKGTAYTERMQTPVAARRPTNTHLYSKDPDTRHSEIVSRHIFGPRMSYSQIQRHEFAGPPKNKLNTGHEPTKSGIVSPLNSPLGIRDVASWGVFDDTGYAEAKLFTGANCTKLSEPGWPNTFPDAVHPLPRSSPSPSNSQSSDNSILDLDISPSASIRPGRSDDFLGDPSRSFLIREGSADLDEAKFTIPSPTNLIEEELAAERSRTTYRNDVCAFSSTGNNDSKHPSSFESGCGSLRVMTNQGVTEDDAPSDISVDFLSDPHPWETIGRILKLRPPEASAMQSVKINFTKDREGVGYVTPENSGTCNAHSSDATSFETRINGKPTHVASRSDTPILDSEVSTVDNHMTIDTPDSPYTSNSTRPLFDAGPPFTTQAEGDPYIHVHAPREALSIPVIHCIQNGHTGSSSPVANIAETTAAEPDVDMTFDGPCLFGDSDLEEDE